MSEKYKTYTGNTYFLTLTIAGWVDLFTRKEFAELIEDNLNYCIEKKGLEVFSYCIMPSHVHLIARTEKYPISNWLRDFKGFTSRKLFECVQNHEKESRKGWLLYLFNYFSKPHSGNRDFKIWKNGSHAMELYSDFFYKQKEDYIHFNPVESGLVTDPIYYRYSSANPNCRVKVVVY